MENKKLKDSIIELRKQGYSVSNIKNILGCSTSTISYHINNNGLGGVHEKFKIDTIDDDKFLASVDDAIVKQIINLKKKGETYKVIFNTVNISYDKIKRICKIFNLNKNKNELKFKDEESITKIQKLYDEIGSIRKVSKILGISRQIISSVVEIKTKVNIDRRKYMVDHVNNHRKKRKKELVDYKGGCCEKCGYNKSMNALQFHHINPDEKDFTIGGRNYSEERMKKEVDKCVLLCGNCHSEIHEEINDNGDSEFILDYINRRLL